MGWTGTRHKVEDFEQDRVEVKCYISRGNVVVSLARLGTGQVTFRHSADRKALDWQIRCLLPGETCWPLHCLIETVI